MLLVVGGGAYYLGLRDNSTSNQIVNTNTKTSPIPTETTIYASPSPGTVIVQVEKETAVSGNETIDLSFHLPYDWKLNEVAKPNNPNNIIKNCAEYVLSSNDGASKLTISPICTGWSATYSNWPQNAVSIKEERNVGNDGHTAYIVRYSDADNQYKYVEGEKGTSNKIMDAISIRYNSSTSNFLPANITLSSTGTNIETVLAVTDEIVTSMRLND